MSGPDEHRAHGGGIGRGAAIGQIGVLGQHVIKLGHRQRGIVDNGEIGGDAGHGLDIALPFDMVFDIIDRNPDHLGVALFKFGRKPGHGTEFGRADRSEILGVAENDGIAAIKPVVKPDLAFGAVGREIGGERVDAQGHGSSFHIGEVEAPT